MGRIPQLLGDYIQHTDNHVSPDVLPPAPLCHDDDGGSGSKTKQASEPEPSEFGYPPYYPGNRSARSWKRDPVKACRGRNEGAECALCTFRSYQCKGKCQNGVCTKD